MTHETPTSQRWRLGCLVASLTLLAVFVTAVTATWNAIRPRSTHIMLSREPSPTGSWTAILNEDIDEIGLLAMTDIVAGVSLVSRERPTEEVELLGVDTGGNVSKRPRMEWSAPNVLRVTVPNISSLKVLTRQVGEITVDLRFEPDDPVARAAWRKENGMRPEP